ncbi:LppU/SCO3897 family protein [Micromonospora sp. IBHARD004]|uniref:LppU/SCO3897 family protein n=1 Tax=Micromonospora sp. IBHARD004 TaxID=3457764 RepID=UPI004059F67C
MIAVLAVLAVLVLGGAATLYLLGRDDAAPQAGTTQPSATDPSAAATQPAATAPAPASSADPRFVKVGQCVRNAAPAGGKPKLLISACGAKTYQVLRRYDGATSGEKDAQAKCAKVDGYTDWYFFDSELDTLDFVLCLKQR